MIDRERRLLLAARRQHLVRQAALQRRQLAVAVAPLAQAWAWVERGLIVAAPLRRRPWLLALALPLALLAWWRPRGFGFGRAVAALPLLWRLRAAWLPWR